MDPLIMKELRAQLDDWVAQGYQILADEVDGQIRVTVVYVARADEPGKERDQQMWPLVPETMELLQTRGIALVSRPQDV